MIKTSELLSFMGIFRVSKKRINLVINGLCGYIVGMEMMNNML